MGKRKWADNFLFFSVGGGAYPKKRPLFPSREREATGMDGDNNMEGGGGDNICILEKEGGEEDRITSMLPKCLFLFLSISPTRSGAAYWSKRQSTLFPFPRVYFPFATPTHVRGTERPFLLLPHNTHHGKKRGERRERGKNSL